MCSRMSSTTVESLRERSPSSYSLKIQNFSQLEKCVLFSDGKYQSRFFSSGGYNWRMIIYPKGNDMDKGSGFISMYVEIDSTSLSTPSSEVFADFRFFVFNKKKNKYLIVHDVESKSFNTLRPVWGLPQMLRLDTFKDPKKGYLFLDQCEFGVDVIVAPSPTNWEILSFNDKFSLPKFSWTLKNFSEMKQNCYTSSTFSMGGWKWALQLYPKGGLRVEQDKWISIYLGLAESEALQENGLIFTQAHLRVRDPRGCNHLSRLINYWHDKLNLGWGFPQFVTIDNLRKTYLDKEDTLNVEIEFDVVSTTKYSQP